MEYNGVIHRKFALLDKYILKLEGNLSDVTYEAFKDDWALQRVAERSLQVMIEIVIDVSERIIALRDAGPAATASEAIEKLQILGVIKSADYYINMIKFRNFIVHQYEEIEPEILFNFSKNKLQDFRKFRDEIDKA